MIEIPTYKFALRADVKDDVRFIPTQAHDRDTGYDVRACMPNQEPIELLPNKYYKVPLGIRAMCPEGWWFKLVPRSSSFLKRNCHFLYGTVDEGYEGELIAAFQYIEDFKLYPAYSQSKYIEFGDAIGQIIPVKRQEMIVENVSNEEIERLYSERNSSRKTGGFGSSGN